MKKETIIELEKILNSIKYYFNSDELTLDVLKDYIKKIPQNSRIRFEGSYLFDLGYKIQDIISKTGGNCYKCGKFIEGCLLGDACCCKEDCSKNKE